MATPIGLRVAISGQRGALATALRDALPIEGYEIVKSGDVADIAICTSGLMLIRHAEDLSEDDVLQLYAANYSFPRFFTELHLGRMRRAGVKNGQIIHLGSNSARYGKPGAEDYAAMKTALAKYCEVRGATARADGVRITVLNFGGVATDSFWTRAGAGADPALVATLQPDFEKALTAEDVVETVLAVMCLPTNVALKDALIVAQAYQ